MKSKLWTQESHFFLLERLAEKRCNVMLLLIKLFVTNSDLGSLICKIMLNTCTF